MTETSPPEATGKPGHECTETVRRDVAVRYIDTAPDEPRVSDFTRSYCTRTETPREVES